MEYNKLSDEIIAKLQALVGSAECSDGCRADGNICP